jgi:hypothetical protein
MSEAEIVARRRKWTAKEKAALLAEVAGHAPSARTGLGGERRRAGRGRGAPTAIGLSG